MVYITHLKEMLNNPSLKSSRSFLLVLRYEPIIDIDFKITFNIFLNKLYNLC